MRIMLKSKIHRARVTAVNIDYQGSIAIDEKLMREADILPYEQVQVLNLNNSARFTTYAIKSQKAGEICINGAAARLAAKGDVILILSYCQVADDEARSFIPRLVYVDARNAILDSKWLAQVIPL
jgi:aspartate 1-decarboxylase